MTSPPPRPAGVVALKLYPAGATTNSDAGVTDIRKTYATLEAMQKAGLLLLVHGEVTDGDVDVFDREAFFIDRVMTAAAQDFPELKVVFEHITTKEAAQYVTSAGRLHRRDASRRSICSYNRNAIFMGGLRPHYYCLPVLKREEHRLALIKAATSGSAKFFLGTDSAPHASVDEGELGLRRAGMLHRAVRASSIYAEAFEAAGALDKLEAFASFHGADFYGLPRNTTQVTLRKTDWTLPESVAFGEAADSSTLRGGEGQRCSEELD